MKNDNKRKLEIRLSDNLHQRLNSWPFPVLRPVQPVSSPKGQIIWRLPKIAFNVKEAAWVLGVSARTLRRLVHRGLLRPSKASRRFIFSYAEIERFLKETTND
jgi:excisionase family DNA binding protein